jgi:5,5'-dehydrodivanillate O-demethylase oxygenase subunit
VLSSEKNRLLTEVGPGTAMGDYLRRYWMPIAGASELDASPIKAMRLFGEDLVLYRDQRGGYGLLDRRCPHRRADLVNGWVEDDGIRCNYHGWKMNGAGNVIEKPYDAIVVPTARGKDHCRVAAYPVKECAGLLFAYLGPAPAPELPIWAPFTWENGFREIATTVVPCNWFQCQENSCDPLHFEWMHEHWQAKLVGESVSKIPRHIKLAFEEFDYGFVYRRVREGQAEDDPHWRIGRVALWPNAFYLGNHFEWRVPIDDENTLSICWFFVRVPKGREPYVQETVPTWESPLRYPDGRLITSNVINQDYATWIGQGRIADRTRETLSAGDRGIVMMRKRYFEELSSVANGTEPKGIIRDPVVASCVDLPTYTKKFSVEGISLAEYAEYPTLKARLYGRHLAFGQPPDVRRAFEEAMGIAR